MIKIGILGSSGRVGSLLIDDLKNDKEAKLACVHVFDKIEKIGITAGASTPDWIIKEVYKKCQNR